jgi:hypothetical protein
MLRGLNLDLAKSDETVCAIVHAGLGFAHDVNGRVIIEAYRQGDLRVSRTKHRVLWFSHLEVG